MVPWTALAQGGAALTGVARDESGAVLPGVVVEASSPVLIEKTRSSVTDGTGRYVILDLRPGTYTVTFTLTGFATGKRENGIVSGTGSITLDTPMKLGNVAETVTVTGETPTVDIQTTTRETVMDQAIVAAIPTSRNSFAVGVLIPGVTVSDGFGSFQDVGGALGPTTLALMVHGSRVSDQRRPHQLHSARRRQQIRRHPLRRFRYEGFRQQQLRRRPSETRAVGAGQHQGQRRLQPWRRRADRQGQAVVLRVGPLSGCR